MRSQYLISRIVPIVFFFICCLFLGINKIDSYTNSTQTQLITIAFLVFISNYIPSLDV